MQPRIPMRLRTDTIDYARSDLVEMLGWYITDDDGEPDAATIETLVTDEVAEKWWRVAVNLSDQRHMLIDLGVDSWVLNENPEVWATLYSPTWKPNPAYYETEEGRRCLQSELAALEDSRPKVRVPSIRMSITECSAYIQLCAGNKIPGGKPLYSQRRLRRMMNSGDIPYEQHGRESFTFCCKSLPGLPALQVE